MFAFNLTELHQGTKGRGWQLFTLPSRFSFKKRSLLLLPFPGTFLQERNLFKAQFGFLLVWKPHCFQVSEKEMNKQEIR